MTELRHYIFAEVDAVGPAQQMGTFLRVWRSEWAGLSRAQLAMLLQRIDPRAGAVTAHVIRRWEEGQLPGSTEELEALVQAMRSHGLAEWEADQFRRTAMDACVDRHFPGLVPAEEFAHHPEVDRLAREMYWRSNGGRSACDLPALTSCAAELELACSPPERRAVRGTVEHRQEIALGYLRCAVAGQHTGMGRLVLAAEGWQRAYEWLTERIGRSRSEEMPDVDWPRFAWMSWKLATGGVTLSAGPAWEVYRYGRRLADGGRDKRTAAELLSMAVCGAYGLRPGLETGLRHALRTVQDEVLARTEEFTPFTLDGTRCGYAELAVRDGDIAQAEALLEATAHAQNGGPAQLVWLGQAAGLCRHRGRMAEACEYYVRGLAIATEQGCGLSEAALLGALAECGGRLVTDPRVLAAARRLTTPRLPASRGRANDRSIPGAATGRQSTLGT